MKKAFLFLLLFLFITNCDENDFIDNSGELSISEVQLPELPSGYYYEAWLLLDGYFVTAGKFVKNDLQENPVLTFSNIDISDLTKAESFAITVEHNSDGAGPSGYTILAGDFDGNTALLKSTGTTSFGISPIGESMSAHYTLQNATTQDESYTQNGIWFFKEEEDARISTLDLNFENIKYQAWLESEYSGNTYYVNMGVISGNSGKDNSNIFSPNPAEVPLFPGEDFLIQPGETNFPAGFFPREVNGSKVIITPIPESYVNSITPFPFYLLHSVVPNDAKNSASTTYEMEKNSDEFSASVAKL